LFNFFHFLPANLRIRNKSLFVCLFMDSVIRFRSSKGALLVLISLLLLAVNNEWSEGIVGFKSNSTTLEMVPVMPPVQEPVAADAAQNDLPKAMVFESPPNAASGPSIIAPVSVPTEVKK
jgi:hypothetical protein